MNESKVQAETARRYCSQQRPDEPLAGTADQVDVWLLLEYKPAWKARALEDNALASETSAWLSDTVAVLAGAGLKARPQFVRQPEYDVDNTRLMVTHGGRTFEFSGTGYDYLHDLDLAGFLRDGVCDRRWRILDEARYLVCTNGQRDVCCARYGLPVYGALRERVGERAWQATHLGGHRFAPNVLTLPDASLYGRVQVEDVEGFVATVEAGELDFPRLRGRTVYPPLVQAAEALLGRDAVRLLHVDGDESQARVTFAGADETHAVTVARAGEPWNVLKSCDDDADKPVLPIEAVS